ncbi:hypothetical protein [Nissabacter sp. SGAir0207]|uniref:hypothetical protein n=1 Tax=Nissabacter sp. SGAir0207 TaxID=2126321 RepID=UPI0010F9FEA3|nr:hypothetical protein [Nissabacter sp. SGAir0207]
MKDVLRQQHKTCLHPVFTGFYLAEGRAWGYTVAHHRVVIEEFDPLAILLSASNIMLLNLYR